MENLTTNIYKNQLHEDWSIFISELAEWRTFFTFTWKEFHSQEMVIRKMRSLVQILNRDLYGKSYTRLVGHSYFSYAFGLEHQSRGALHVHMIVDKPIHFDLVHAVLRKYGGWCNGRKIEDVLNAIAYTTKYAVKGGELNFYKSTCNKLPRFVPMWYLQASGLLVKSEKWDVYKV